MSYRSILVNLDIDGPAAPRIKLGIELAGRFDATLIGFCAADAPLPAMVGPDGGAIAVEVLQQLRDDIQQRFKELRTEFEKLVAGAVKTQWVESLDNPNRALAAAARLADLIVIGASEGASTGDAYRAVDPGSLVLQAGRPMLVVAGGAEHVLARKVVVAWKDTREARRAVADALPLLKSADEVIVVTVDSDPDDWVREAVADVVTYLARHDIKARGEVIEDRDEGGKLIEFVTSAHADLIVSGAYGHSRIRQWAFGGVTRSLLDEIGLNRLMSS